MSKFNKNLIQQLDKLGVTPLEAKIYLKALENSQITVSKLSKELETLRASIYRSLKNLKKKGLVVTSGKKPIKIRGVDPSIALKQLVESQYKEKLSIQSSIKDLLSKKTKKPEALKVEFLQGQQEIFAHALKEIKNLKDEMLILSIGEEIPQEVFIEITRSIKKKINIKMIAEEYNSENKNLLNNWEKNGWKIRYLQDPKLTFTLVIYDTRTAVIQIRNQDNRDQRVGIAVYNPGYVEAQKKYFSDLWKQAEEI